MRQNILINSNDDIDEGFTKQEIENLKNYYIENDIDKKFLPGNDITELNSLE